MRMPKRGEDGQFLRGLTLDEAELEQFHDLYAEGHSDAEIGRRMGVCGPTVSRWRRLLELPPTGGTGRLLLRGDKARARNRRAWSGFGHSSLLDLRREVDACRAARMGFPGLTVAFAVISRALEDAGRELPTPDVLVYTNAVRRRYRMREYRRVNSVSVKLAEMRREQLVIRVRGASPYGPSIWRAIERTVDVARNGLDAPGVDRTRTLSSVLA